MGSLDYYEKVKLKGNKAENLQKRYACMIHFDTTHPSASIPPINLAQDRLSQEQTARSVDAGTTTSEYDQLDVDGF